MAQEKRHRGGCGSDRVKLDLTHKAHKLHNRTRRAELNALEFAVGLLKFKPEPYQAHFLLDPSEKLLFVGGRKVAKTTLGGIRVIHYAAFHPDKNVNIYAPSERQSREFFDTTRNLMAQAGVMHRLCSKVTETMIDFNNGTKVRLFPASYEGVTVRGPRADMIVFDEAAFIARNFYVAVEPSLAVGDNLRLMLTTPAGKGGRVWEAWNDPAWSKHHATTSENPYVDAAFLDEQRRILTDWQFRQEFMGEFVEEADVWLSMDLIASRYFDGAPLTGPQAGKDYFLGVDVARYGTDETAYVIVSQDRSGLYEVVSYETTNKKPITDLVARTVALNRTWDFKRILVDESGLGAGAVDYLKADLSNVQGFRFTSQDRENLYTRLKMLLEKDQLHIPNDKKLTLQLNSYTYEYSTSNALRIKKTETGHDDIADALALAVYTGDSGSVDILSIPEWSNFMEGLR